MASQSGIIVSSSIHPFLALLSGLHVVANVFHQSGSFFSLSHVQNLCTFFIFALSLWPIFSSILSILSLLHLPICPLKFCELIHVGHYSHLVSLTTCLLKEFSFIPLKHSYLSHLSASRRLSLWLLLSSSSAYPLPGGRFVSSTHCVPQTIRTRIVGNLSLQNFPQYSCWAQYHRLMSRESR